jgi:hypothetical protein
MGCGGAKTGREGGGQRRKGDAGQKQQKEESKKGLCFVICLSLSLCGAGPRLTGLAGHLIVWC